MENPVTTIATASKGVSVAFVWKTLLALLAIALLFVLIYWFVWLKGLSWPTIKKLVSEDAAKYDNPSNVEKILMQGVKEIVTDYRLMVQAKTYAKQSGMPLERVLVNNSLALAKQYQYIPS